MDDIDITYPGSPNVREYGEFQEESQQWWSALSQTERDLHIVKLHNERLVSEREMLIARRDLWRGYCEKLVALLAIAKDPKGTSLYGAPIVKEVRHELENAELAKRLLT